MRTWSALLLSTTFMSGGLAAQSQADLTADAIEVRLEKLVGQTARVCGGVVDHTCRLDDQSRLDLGTRFTDPGASIRVPSTARARFPLAFERRMHGRNVCATGPISREGRRFFILIEDPASISMEAGGEPAAVPSNVVSSCDRNVAMPKVLKEVKPVYPTGVAPLIGTVFMDAIVGLDGRPRAIRVTRSLDSAGKFDQAATTALQQWRFEPGTHEGRPTPVYVGVSMTFTAK